VIDTVEELFDKDGKARGFSEEVTITPT